MNTVYLSGHLGKDPDLRHTPKGTAYCRFSLATTERRGGSSPTTLWNDIVAWGKLAEICNKYLSKGAKILIRGHISKSSWEKDGVKRTKTEVVIDELEFLGDKNRNDAGNEEESELPF